MELSTQSQVLAATRNAASAAAGAILVFGLSSKIDPATATAIINSLGTVVSDVIVLVGLVTPVVTSLYAWWSASEKNQVAQALKSEPKVLVAAVQSLPAAQVTVTDPKLATPGVQVVKP